MVAFGKSRMGEMWKWKKCVCICEKISDSILKMKNWLLLENEEMIIWKKWEIITLEKGEIITMKKAKLLNLKKEDSIEKVAIIA